MKKNLALAIVVGAASLTACGSKTDANEKNFGMAMTQYFDKKGDLCLNTKRWPIDLSEGDLRMQKTLQAGSANQMAALESVGLVKGEDVEVDVMGFMDNKPTGRKTTVRRYTLTDAAKPFAHEKEVDSFGLAGKTTEKQVDLCWGNKRLDKIVKWEGPMKFGDYQEAGITYTYKIINLVDWAKNPQVQAAFPVIKNILDGAAGKPAKHTVKLTSEGWEPKGLD